MTAPEPGQAMTDAEMRERLGAGSVAIVGCGGLGSNVAAMLLRSGVRTLTLIDFDRVDASNLNRQLFFADQIGRPKTEALAESLLRIDPGARLTLHDERATAQSVVELVAGTDVIVEAVDGAATKAMIVNVCAEALPAVPLVTASGLAGYDSANTIATEQLAEDVYLVGDLRSDSCAGLPLLASRVMVAAAHQAHMAIRLLLGIAEP